MHAWLTVALTYPTIVWTTLLAVAVLYWLFVIVGAVHLDTGSADVGDVGHVGGEGAHVGGEGAHGHADGGDGGHGDADVDVDGGPIDIVGALRLRSVPLMVSVSFGALFGWLLSWGAVEWLGLRGAAWGSLALLLSAVVALPLTSLAIRPLAPLFKPNVAGRREHLVGKLCVVRTGEVDHRFGEALLEDGGAGLVLRVRVERGERLRRGDEAVIVAWDEQLDAFVVAPMPRVEAPDQN